MYRSKKFILISFLAVALMACGGGSDGSSTEGSTTTTTTTTDGSGGSSTDGSTTTTTNASAYWRTHLSVVYDYIDPSQVRVSIGDFGGTEAQYGVKGNAPDPAEVSVASGVVMYELVSSDYYLGSSSDPWDRLVYAGNITARNNDADVRGVALFQMTEDNKLKAEFFPNQTASEITGFTQAAEIYER